MQLKDYQKQAASMSTYPENFPYDKLFVSALGLVGESGEVADALKKIVRKGRTELSDEDRMNLLYELGDVLWYVAEISSEIGVSLEDVASGNIKKLTDRAERDDLLALHRAK